MQDEAVDPRIRHHLAPGIRVGRRLQGLTRLGAIRVEALFGEQHTARDAVQKEFGPAHVLGDHAEISKRDPRRVRSGQGRAILPGARLEQVFRIRVVGEVPLEVAAHARDAVELVDEAPSRDGTGWVISVGQVPMMIERQTDADRPGDSAHRSVRQAHDPHVIPDEHIRRNVPHVRPVPVGRDLVAHDEV